MSFKQSDINLSNYEEFFVLYMDNELSGEQKLAVENFISRHPHLAEELDILMSTKLPLDETSFSGKEELLSANMKMNLVDESLLLYIDDELNASEKISVEEKLREDKDFGLQHSLLMQTKLDASEKILHPNKKELYRQTERVNVFKVWMRVAVAVILLLLGSLFFLTNRNEKLPVTNDVVENPLQTNTPKNKQEKVVTPVEQLIKQTPVQQDAPIVKAPKKASNPVIIKNSSTPDVHTTNNGNDDVYANNTSLERKEPIRFDMSRFANALTIAEPTVNKTITRTSVTSSQDLSYNKQDDPANNPEVGWAVETQKKTRAKGFFRKVSRFIERNTGIGTVNADNELLIGAVALKLK